MIYGVNYGHHFTKATFSQSSLAADLDELKSSGCVAIRVAMPPFDGQSVQLTQQIAIAAKQRGFIVTWGVGVGTLNIDATRWASFLASFLIYGTWAYKNGIDYFAIGNEEEIKADNSTLTPATVRSDILALATSLKSRFPTKLIYATDQLNIPNWNNTGALDAIGFNIYGPGPQSFQNAVNAARSNPKAIVTEWSTAQGINDATMNVNGNDATWGSVLKSRRDILNLSGMPHYIFTLRGNAFGIDDTWSLWVGDTRRIGWTSL